MARRSVLLVLACALALPVSVYAAPPALEKTSFTKPVALRGKLGEATVQVNLRTKAEFEDGIEGDYFVFGQANRVLLAGEIEGDELFLEESVNGKDVSGQWNGKLLGDTIAGEWQSVDGSLTKPFQIKLVPSAAKAGKETPGRQVKQ